MMIERARTEIRSTVEDARAAVWNLRHSEEGGDVSAALARLTTRVAAESGLTVELHSYGAARPLGPDAARGLLLSVREALSNAVRHAAAKRITVSLTFTHDGLEVGVADDGCGFDWRPHTSGEDRHYGLIGMQERIETLGGRFELESAPGRGTRVGFTIPSS